MDGSVQRQAERVGARRVSCGGVNRASDSHETIMMGPTLEVYGQPATRKHLQLEVLEFGARNHQGWRGVHHGSFDKGDKRRRGRCRQAGMQDDDSTRFTARSQPHLCSPPACPPRQPRRRPFKEKPYSLPILQHRSCFVIAANMRLQVAIPTPPTNKLHHSNSKSTPSLLNRPKP